MVLKRESTGESLTVTKTIWRNTFTEPVSKKQYAVTGLLTKEITPELHRLQEKFLVFEDQTDNEWDRAWYPFESEFPDADLEQYTKEEAEEKLVRRFVWLNIWIDAAMVRSFYRLPLKEIRSQGGLASAGV